eukprot:CAMPEP_0118674710 /NCGR_PEP_ID=MMETSP0800-20121206/1038_1 /TAXON_ID=210618 ORGANISM="Striatella unipunctata, Strain CCMP2910" /NCGR_SAMPLE_ID=MMETSP0800 /ASSEMBLY_ACC=CAM_ASM_000638 /LENGTH=369 /DNA_ID=CAMNT_0006569933 /DNA_START=297 /DNA_END=1406 /DNA_ORIENTATION=-
MKMMQMGKHEQNSLQELEQASNLHRRKDLQLKFMRDLSKTFLTSLPSTVILLVGWRIVNNIDSIAEGIDAGFSVVVAIYLFDEVLKALISLNYLQDRKDEATEALEAINTFIEQIPPSGSKTEQKKEHHMEDVSNVTEQDPEQPGDYSTSFEIIEESSATDNLTLKNISLSYKPRNNPVLERHSISFERFKIHGLIGESGCGKSTVLKIVAGLLTPDEGTMHVWKGVKFAYVGQDEKVFARSIRENVTYSKFKFTDDEAWEALRLANIDSWVMSLPEKLDTVLTEAEKAVSGGQLQRLLLAHFFCTCRHADFVLLDESLSALDKHSREILIDNLGECLRGKTAIIVTHQSEFLRICDKVHNVYRPDHVY